MAKNEKRIAFIAGDGIGTQVMPEGVRVLKAAAERFDLGLAFDEFDFASCDDYARHGKMMPDGWKETVGNRDAGQGIANPIGQIWAGAMMLEHLGHADAAAAIVAAIEGTLARPETRTRDLGGAADTALCGKAVAAAVLA